MWCAHLEAIHAASGGLGLDNSAHLDLVGVLKQRAQVQRLLLHRHHDEHRAARKPPAGRHGEIHQTNEPPANEIIIVSYIEPSQRLGDAERHTLQ